MVAIDHAGIASGDAMPHRADASKLLEVEMDQIARMFAFMAPHRLGWF